MSYFGKMTPKRKEADRVSQNTIFGRPTPYARPKPIRKHKPHKERCDKTHDIRFKVTPHEKKRLKLKAMDKKQSLTSYLSDVLEQELPNAANCDYTYNTKGVEVGVMICRESFDRVQYLAADWDLPYRQVAYQVIKDVLEREQEGFSLNDWRDK